MSEININGQSLPSRCEICHQADCFDEVNNYCSRCANTKLNIPANNDNPPVKLIFYLEWRLTEIMRAIWSLISCNLKNTIAAGLLNGILFVLAAGIINGWSSLPVALNLFSLAIIATGILSLPLLIYFSSRRIVNGYHKIGNQTRITFTTDGYEVSTGKSFSMINWDLIKMALETNYCFLISQHNGTEQIIVKNQLEVTEIEKLRDTLNLHIPDRAKLLNRSLPFYQRAVFCLGVYAVLTLTGLTFAGNFGINLHNEIKANDSYNRAMELWNSTEYKRAESYYRQAMELEPEYKLTCLFAIGCCRMKQDDLIGAEQQFRAALAIVPNYTEALEGLGDIAFQKKEYAEAINYYEQTLAKSEQIKSRYYLALSYKELNRQSEATRQLLILIQQNSGSNYAKRAQSLLDEWSSKNQIQQEDYDQE